MYAYLIIAALAAAVSVFFITRYFGIRRAAKKRAVIVIPVSAEDDDLERQVRACYWEECFADPRYAKAILLVILENSANAYTARRLAQELENVSVVHVSSLKDYLIRNYK